MVHWATAAPTVVRRGRHSMLGDTIVAQASREGAAERAVLRVSGPHALGVVAALTGPLPRRRAQLETRLGAGFAPLEALVLVMPGPASFTGEDVVELHVPGSPLLVRRLIERLVRAGDGAVRPALPGEFTARACHNGRLDLAQAEGILLLLHAADTRAAAAANEWLSGGYSELARRLRAALQDVLAEIEAELDFADGETATLAVDVTVRQAQLAAIADEFDRILASLPVAAPGGEHLLLGRANAGKSSLANALAGRDASLVDGSPGTTRDLLRIELEPGVVLWDAPGDLDTPAAADAQALALRDRIAGRATAALWVLDATAPMAPPSPGSSPLPCSAVVWTKCDAVTKVPPLPAELAPHVSPDVPVLCTSARTGAGLDRLRAHLRATETGGLIAAGGPLRAALGEAQQAIGRARAVAGTRAELAAVELQAALRAIDGLGGSHSPEALLDRIYGRFCLGK